MRSATATRKTLDAGRGKRIVTVRFALIFVALSPLLSLATVEGKRLSGVLLPVVLFVLVLQLLLTPYLREARRLRTFYSLYAGTILWMFVVSFSAQVPLDDYTVQQSLSYACLPVGVAIGIRAATYQSVEISRALILKASMISTFLTTCLFLLNQVSFLTYPFSPVMPAMASLGAMAAPPDKRRLALVCIAVNVATILMGGNRTVPAVLLAALFAMKLAPRGLLRAWLPGATLSVLMVAGAILAPRFFPIYSDRWAAGGDKSLDIGNQLLNTSGRFNVWKLLWTHGQDHQPFGSGIGAASRAIQQVYPGIEHPHNEYLRLWFDFGMVGMLIWLASVVCLMGVLRSSMAIATPPESIVLAVAFSSIFSIMLIAITLNPLVAAPACLWVGVLSGMGIAHASRRSIDSGGFVKLPFTSQQLRQLNA
jgi:O-antigen ligase